MRRMLGVQVAAGLVLVLTGCGSQAPTATPRAGSTSEGSTAFFFETLAQTDALADYITQPTTLADLLPNRTFRVSYAGAARHAFSWSKQVVVGTVTGVRHADRNRRLRLTIAVQESFPATTASSIDVEVGSFPERADQYLVSASALDRVVVGIDRYDNDAGEEQVTVARAGQFFGVVDDQDRITWPNLRPDEFTEPDWDQDMTSLDGLRRQATAAPSTVTVER